MRSRLSPRHDRSSAWVGSQRQSHRRGELPEDRVRRLEALPGWLWDRREEYWEEGYARLLAFAERNGHGRVPNAYRDADGYQLGYWVRNQRHRGDLSETRVRRLEEIPGWVWDAREAGWEDGYARLLAFAEREGHPPPRNYLDEHGYRLGGWMTRQRALHTQGRLTEDRVRRLEAVPGWTWEAHEAAWEEGYARLRRFAEREGHARVPISYRDDGYPLGYWVGNQRQSRRRGKLRGDRVRRLEALRGWAWVVPTKRVSAGEHS